MANKLKGSLGLGNRDLIEKGEYGICDGESLMKFISKTKEYDQWLTGPLESDIDFRGRNF